MIFIIIVEPIALVDLGEYLRGSGLHLVALPEPVITVDAYLPMPYHGQDQAKHTECVSSLTVDLPEEQRIADADGAAAGVNLALC